ncbi:MAG: DNA mismatch repair endonuclease MutL [bacterium]|nr:DNA mismatch repair endonuclease MutL [bacterium]
MSCIKVLPENVSNRIAAGEVIERPASVIKELVENSIDSGADKIIIKTENAGIKSITVIDNGTGMDQDDALLCLEPHATSKIKSENDINHIMTMGFRGEALPSIASVSRFRIRTRLKKNLEGHEVIVNGGRYISESPIGCAQGTEIKVSDLFYNTPARRKFLKSKITEEKHIFETICLLSIANAEVLFELNVDGKNILTSPADKDPKSRLAIYLGRKVIGDSILVDYEESGIYIHGYISKPGTVKSSRREQRFFVNGRPIRSITLSNAVRDAYNTMIMKGSFPITTLFVKLNAEDIDVNVHPAKHEIRFKNGRQVSHILQTAVKNGLSSGLNPLPSVNINNLSVKSIIDSAEIDYSLKSNEVNHDEEIFSTIVSSENKPSLNKERVKVHNSDKVIDYKNTKPVANKKSNIHICSENKLSLPGCGYINVLAILDKTYILCSSDLGLVVVDQHAAHERILFEKLLNEHSQNNLSQQLLIPLAIDLSRIELNLIKKNITIFINLGFQIDIFGDETILLTSVPHSIEMDNISGLISDLLDDIINNKDLLKNLNEEKLARIACRHAVKSHDYLVKVEAEELLKELVRCELPFSCPHGRPTVINISYKEFEKRFGRKL